MTQGGHQAVRRKYDCRCRDNVHRVKTRGGALICFKEPQATGQTFSRRPLAFLSAGALTGSIVVSQSGSSRSRTHATRCPKGHLPRILRKRRAPQASTLPSQPLRRGRGNRSQSDRRWSGMNRMTETYFRPGGQIPALPSSNFERLGIKVPCQLLDHRLVYLAAPSR